ncbi:MAG: DUF4846 domain-containing protein, partial [Calditrichota bacterium]
MLRFFMSISLFCACMLSAQTYSWTNNDSAETIHSRFATPEGFQRMPAQSGGFAHWLQHLPLKPGKPEVMLYNGLRKGNQRAHVAVIDIDIGKKDLQQCADAVMRLRAEYLYSTRQFSAIHFNYTSGDEIAFLRWSNGSRPVVNGNAVRWRGGGTEGKGYANFRRYLDSVFTYAGTDSLLREMKAVAKPRDVQIGEEVIQGGFP